MIVDLEQRAYQHIRSRVLRGELRPGQRVSEVEIARQLRISRTPVRHAIRQLEGDGLIEQVPRSGTFIRTLTEADILELWQLREALEVMAVAIAVYRINREQLAELDRLIGEFRAIATDTWRQNRQTLETEQMERLAKTDVSFHTLILQAAGNQRFIKVFADLHLMASLLMVPTAPVTVNVPRMILKIYRDHARIFRAIRRGNAAAAQHCMSMSLGPWAPPSARANAAKEGFYIGKWSSSLRDWLMTHDNELTR